MKTPSRPMDPRTAKKSIPGAKSLPSGKSPKNTKPQKLAKKYLGK